MALVTIGKIIDRCRAKVSLLSPFLTDNQKENYDSEFRELQLNSEIFEYKFNGGLFALEKTQHLFLMFDPMIGVPPSQLIESPIKRINFR